MIYSAIYLMRRKTLPSKVLRSWVESSSFVFQGRVTALGECNLHGVKPNEKMVVVHIDDVVIAPRTLGDLKGQALTVYLKSPNGVKKNQKVTFFATGWHYGNNIGVIEVGRTDLTADEVRKDTIDEQLKQLDERLEERIKSAEVVVSGSVISTSHDENASNLSMGEETDWYRAQIYIESVEKGHTQDLHILFPGEGGKEFMKFPAYYEGQRGVWLLHSVTESDMDEREQRKSQVRDKQEKEENLMATDPLDYHAISALPRIQTLLWRINKQ
jgi:hypothetical protein